MSKQPCVTCGVRPKWKTLHRCAWCWTASKPIMAQVAAAERRLAEAMAKPGFEYRARVPASEWPEGHRWCAGCQWMVPLDYVPKGSSRCKACASKAAHASKVAATYSITGEQYQQLFAWQGGRCYICGKKTVKRLAVDHNHATGEVRGLLCANDEWGCNVSLRVILDDLNAARRLVSYIRKGPLQRMLEAEPRPFTQ